MQILFMIKFSLVSGLLAWRKIFHWNNQQFSNWTCNFLRLKYHWKLLWLPGKGGLLCRVHAKRPPFYKSTGRWQTMMKIWFFEVVMAIEMCKILVLKGEHPGKPSVLGGCCLHAGRFVCVLSPTSHCLFANSLKNWTRSLIGAWRGLQLLRNMHLVRPESPLLVALAYFLMVWNK